LTFLDTSKNYKMYNEENRVLETKRGDELFTHYDKVESSVSERYENSKAIEKTSTKTTTKTTSTKKTR
ncbi:MAG: PcfB family protein, partial [Bacteroidales bacterium]